MEETQAGYGLPTLYTSYVEDHLHGMEADLPIFSMFPSPVEDTSASPWHGTRSLDSERHSPSQEHVASHPALDTAFPGIWTTLNAAGVYVRPCQSICLRCSSG